MKSPMSSSHNPKASNPQLCVSSYFNNPSMEIHTIDKEYENGTNHSDNFLRQFSLPQENLQDFLTGFNAQEQAVHANQMDILHTRERTFDQFVLQDMFRVSLFPRTYNDVESSGMSSTSEDCASMNFSGEAYHLVSPAESRAIDTMADFTASSPSIKKKKHKRRLLMNRSRLGCWICRIKHLKCDETKPACTNCIRFGIECDYSVERPAYVLDSSLRRKKLDSIITKKRRRSESTPNASFFASAIEENMNQSDFSYFRKQEGTSFDAD
ncbi:hypothetical protein METBIDRAFT_12087 [Metschnikowia bicuspidata var. bicuspidata NRRL YB-4993]|uniref:Zn(2)-C6 fungal-type domain-containing protein n=1 Tax=Metschnikowia bicuspidata var. bicuspidata NRRL YB-4993 TaxID=869754 RepID=A0A1A0HBT5_9ASCO|nr:hypothetical protein METBIDRAFT_12087 [Metschnikowia bicuspidata var. bicuspidata NRRL YB-4993]OBA21599.1 hypothetical protein METBIDRAFT_12087 [Metschnikowia bicuspidata var. bicuspidata NRRL YB-4993]